MTLKEYQANLQRGFLDLRTLSYISNVASISTNLASRPPLSSLPVPFSFPYNPYHSSLPIFSLLFFFPPLVSCSFLTFLPSLHSLFFPILSSLTFFTFSCPLRPIDWESVLTVSTCSLCYLVAASKVILCDVDRLRKH